MEQPLPPDGSCLLGSVNLTKFVTDPFTTKAKFDWKKFEEVVAIFSRMLDNVVEINGLPLKEQRQEIREKRRHGMGFLGLGSVMNMIGMSYGDAASVKFTEKVSKLIAMVGYRVGLELAKEKGPAPIMSMGFALDQDMVDEYILRGGTDVSVGTILSGKELWAHSNYMLKIQKVDPVLWGELREHGCRYTHHSSIAPTGTIALSLGNNACIAKGSIIETDSGNKAIEDVTLDDKVNSYNFTTGEFEYKSIKFSGLTRADADVMQLTLMDGKTIMATPDHRFLVRKDGKEFYEELKTILSNGISEYEIAVYN
jgi:ribonucleotide reductase alpha subunit